MNTKNLLYILFAILLSAGSVSSQTARRTITNEDLEKFRQTRLQAENDLRENYARLGFPSPEEMQKQQDQAQIERENLSDKLRKERLESEKIQLALEYLRSQQNYPGTIYVENSGGSYPWGYSGVYYGRYNDRRGFRPGGVFLPGGGYFGPSFNPNQGVVINTVGPIRPPVRIRQPRN